MPLQIVTVPCLSDNYAYLVRDEASGRTALVDAPEAEPIRAELMARGWGLDEIWITHHHGDHIDGVATLRGVRFAGDGRQCRRPSVAAPRPRPCRRRQL